MRTRPATCRPAAAARRRTQGRRRGVRAHARRATSHRLAQGRRQSPTTGATQRCASFAPSHEMLVVVAASLVALCCAAAAPPSAGFPSQYYGVDVSDAFGTSVRVARRRRVRVARRTDSSVALAGRARRPQVWQCLLKQNLTFAIVRAFRRCAPLGRSVPVERRARARARVPAVCAANGARSTGHTDPVRRTAPAPRAADGGRARSLAPRADGARTRRRQ